MGLEGLESEGRKKGGGLQSKLQIGGWRKGIFEGMCDLLGKAQDGCASFRKEGLMEVEGPHFSAPWLGCSCAGSSVGCLGWCAGSCEETIKNQSTSRLHSDKEDA